MLLVSLVFSDVFLGGGPWPFYVFVCLFYLKKFLVVQNFNIELWELDPSLFI